MKKKLLQLTMMLGLGAFMTSNVSAQVGGVPGCPGAYGPTKIITGTDRLQTHGSKMTTNQHWVKDTIYILKDFIRVASGATLTIDPGTIVMGMPAPADTSSLIIEKGGKLIANGTSALPIVFTSCKLQGTRNRGDWGGVVLCGDAPNNLGTNVEMEGHFGAVHGGSNPNDNSGSLQFVRIEYAGVAFEPNKEINGLTFCSVGRGTTIRNVQVTYANDDSYEWFGGTVSTRNLIAWKGIDDDFDTDNGYSGLNQFGLGFRDPEVADFSGSNGFESDNNDPSVDPTFAILPRTSAIFSNFEVWGPKQNSGTQWNTFFKRGAHIRRGSQEKIYNTIFFGWPGDSSKGESDGFMIDGPLCVQFALVDSIRSRNNVVAAGAAPKIIVNTTEPNSAWAPYAYPELWYRNSAYHNQVTTTSGVQTQKKAPFNYNNPLFTLASTSAALNTGSSFQTGGTHPLPIGTYPNGFQSVNFRGAFAGTNWAQDWTEFHPNLFAYTAGAPTRLAAAAIGFDADKVAADAAKVMCVPNPTTADAGTTFAFNLQNPADATITVADGAGKVVFATTGSYNSGINSVDYSAAGLEPGIYYVQVVVNGSSPKTGKLVIIK